MKSESTKVQVKPEPGNIGIAIWVIRVRDWNQVCRRPVSQSSLQIDCCGGLPIELVLKLTDRPLLCMKFPFKLRDFLLLRFDDHVYATRLRVTFIVGTIPWCLLGFCFDRKRSEHTHQTSHHNYGSESRISNGYQSHDVLLF